MLALLTKIILINKQKLTYLNNDFNFSTKSYFLFFFQFVAQFLIYFISFLLANNPQFNY